MAVVVKAFVVYDELAAVVVVVVVTVVDVNAVVVAGVHECQGSPELKYFYS